MKPSRAVTVFACADRDLRGFSFKHDGSDLPPCADSGLWLAIATIPLRFVELEKYTSDPASVLANLQEHGSAHRAHHRQDPALSNPAPQ